MGEIKFSCTSTTWVWSHAWLRLHLFSAVRGLAVYYLLRPSPIEYLVGTKATKINS